MGGWRLMDDELTEFFLVLVRVPMNFILRLLHLLWRGYDEEIRCSQ